MAVQENNSFSVEKYSQLNTNEISLHFSSGVKGAI